MIEWKKARKKPIVIEFREIIGEKEQIDTREGCLNAYAGIDVIIRGVQGEIYPCKKDIFEATYEIVDEEDAWSPMLIPTSPVTFAAIREGIEYMKKDPLGQIKEIDWNFPTEDDDDD